MENKNTTSQPTSVNQSSTNDLDLILSDSQESSPSQKATDIPSTVETSVTPETPSQPQIQNSQPSDAPAAKINNPFETKYKSDSINANRTIATHKFVPSKSALILGWIGLSISVLVMIFLIILLIK